MLRKSDVLMFAGKEFKINVARKINSENHEVQHEEN